MATAMAFSEFNWIFPFWKFTQSNFFFFFVLFFWLLTLYEPINADRNSGLPWTKLYLYLTREKKKSPKLVE